MILFVKSDLFAICLTWLKLGLHGRFVPPDVGNFVQSAVYPVHLPVWAVAKPTLLILYPFGLNLWTTYDHAICEDGWFGAIPHFVFVRLQDVVSVGRNLLSSWCHTQLANSMGCWWAEDMSLLLLVLDVRSLEYLMGRYMPVVSSCCQCSVVSTLLESFIPTFK